MEATECWREHAPSPGDDGEYSENGEHDATAGGTAHRGDKEGADEGDEHADLPEHLCGGDESGCGGIIRRIMGNNRHGNRQIGTGCEARDNQADKQRGEISGKDADDRADSVDQINPVEEQHAANLVCEAAAEQGAEGNGESQDAGKQSNLRGVKTQAVLPHGDGGR